VEPDVVVVGGGAIGVTAAYELSRRGARVTLLDRGDALAAGCSSGNAGLVCPSHSMPLATPAALREGVRGLLSSDGALGLRPRRDTVRWLARFAAACRADRADRGRRAIHALSVASLDLHADLARLGTSFERRGILSVYETRAGLAEPQLGSAEFLTPDEARQLVPALRPGLEGAVLHREEAHVDPLRYVQAIGAAAAAEGAEIRTRVDVGALGRGNVLESSEGRFRPETVVLAAGAWTAKLVPLLPVTGGKGYHVDLVAEPGDPALPLLFPELRCAVTPLDGRLRLTGTLEVSGLDATVRPRRVDAVRAIATRIGREGGRELSVWTGLRPCTPDGLPLIGRVAPSVVVATGHAMKGISLAPITAQLVAELVAGERPSYDLTAFSPDRFRRLLPRR
jgi:D-amino-acid dehydrogenase